MDIMNGNSRSSFPMDERSLFINASTGDLAELQAIDLDLTDSEGRTRTLLHHASKNGHLSVIQHLRECGERLDAADKDGNTALHVAIMSGQIEAMKLLLASGAKDDIMNEDQETPLHLAVKNGNLTLLEAFLAHPAGVQLFPGTGRTVLHLLADRGNFISRARVIFNSRQFRELASIGVHCIPLRRTDKNGQTALHIAARNNSHKFLNMLFEACQTERFSAEHFMKCFNEGSGNVFTPMHAAVDAGNIEVVKVLLCHGASPIAMKKGKPPPLHIACSMGQLDMVKSMVRHCGEGILNHRDHSGGTPLHYAISARGCDVASYLLSVGDVGIDTVDELGMTPLHVAVLLKRLECIKQLVHRKADLSAKDNKGQNLLHIAVRQYEQGVMEYLMILPEVSELLLEADGTGDTPFHLAMKCKKSEFCAQVLDHSTSIVDTQDGNGNHYIHLVSALGNEALLRRVLEVPLYRNALNVLNKSGETPLHLSVRAGHDDCAELLLDHGASSHWSSPDQSVFFHACTYGHVACARVLLDRLPFQRDLTDSRGNTALHFAAKSPCPEMVQFLLDADIKICLNRDQQSFLEIALERGSDALVKTALCHSKWQECLDCNSPDRPHIMLQFIRKMPEAAKLVLDNSFESASIGKSHAEYWEKFNFKYLQLGHHTSRATSDMIDYRRTYLLSHPVVDAYNQLKWKKYGLWVYVVVFTLELILAIFVSIFARALFEPGRQQNQTDTTPTSGDVEHNYIWLQTYRTLALLANLALATMLVIPMVLGKPAGPVKYTTKNLAAFTHPISLIVNFIFLSIPSAQITYPPIAALACFFSWMSVLVSLGYANTFGIYVRMFLQISRTLFQIFFLSFILVLSLSFPLYILVERSPRFSIFQYCLTTVLYYLGGASQQELLVSQAIEGQLRNSAWSLIFDFLAMIFLGIVMINLLVGLAVGDIGKIKKNALIEKKAMLVDYLSFIDRVPIFKRFNVQTHECHPNVELTRTWQLWRYCWSRVEEDAAP
jgi:ankyrin repeat protein